MKLQFTGLESSINKINNTIQYYFKTFLGSYIYICIDISISQ